MKILLDSHVLVWTMQASNTVSPEAKAAICSNDNVVFISIVSLWELRIKEMTKKINLPEAFYKKILDRGFEILPITVAHIETLGELLPYHRDPFDRMLVAQAINEQLILVTRDEEIAKYKVVILKA